MGTIGIILVLAVFGFIVYKFYQNKNKQRPPIGTTTGYPNKEKDEDKEDNDIIKEG